MDPEIGGPPPTGDEAAPAAAAAPAATGTIVPSTGSRPATLRDVAEAEAQKQGVDPRLVHAVITTESSYNPNAHNATSGAHGLMQLMPATAKRWGVDATDPVQNIKGGVSELKSLLDQHQGDVVMALRRFNGSPKASEAATQPYVDKVLGQIQPSQETPPTPGEEPGTSPTLPKPGGGRGMGPGAGGPPPPPAQTGVGRKPPSPADFTRPKTFMERVAPTILDTAEQFDPRTRTGQRNLGGAAGAMVGGAMAAPSAAVSGPVGPATGAVLGAAAGGGIVGEGQNLYDQIVGNKPPSMVSPLTEGATSAATQGAQEAVGQGVGWAVQKPVRLALGTKVGRYAAESLSAAKTATLTKLSDALDTSKDLLRQTKAGAKATTAQATTSTRGMVTSAAQQAKTGVRTAEREGADTVTSAKDLAEHGVQQATEKGEAGVHAARAPYDQMVGAPPPSAAEAGRAANAVIQTGGAARARNIAGKAVDEAAASGPDVDVTGLKAEAQKVIEGQVRPLETSFPRKTPEGISNEEIAAQGGFSPKHIEEMRAQAAGKPGATGMPTTPTAQARAKANLDELTQAVTSAQGEAGQEALKHPAMGILSRIMNAGDTVPFKDAHLWKVELDNSIRNTRDQATKSQVSALTQKFAGSLRSTLREAGHQPYEDATAAYAKIAPLYTKGPAAQLKKVATENPESIVTMLNPNQPTKAKMLVDLLTHQAEAGGDAAGGQAALESVQNAWVRKKVIEGGIDKLGDRIDKIPADFKDAFLGDPKAQGVLDNLKLIHTAYKTAVATSERGVQAATESGRGAVDTARALADTGTTAARDTGQAAMQAVRDQRAGILDQTRKAGAQSIEQAASQVGPARKALQTGKAGFAEQEKELRDSSLGARMRPEAGARTGADLLRSAAMLASGAGGITHSYYGGLSLMRLLKGPTADDLVHWASLSPASTRLFVKAATSAVPGEALANLVRTSGILADAPARIQKAVAGAPTATGTPPPAATTPPIGAPPPPA